mmetsp:Transcript_39631/g.45499  ORF Transcript_39631/g.45499 Transcript_39631/m.45499 type:complete len:96 (-) Transcript_39631:747-1034(-)
MQGFSHQKKSFVTLTSIKYWILVVIKISPSRSPIRIKKKIFSISPKSRDSSDWGRRMYTATAYTVEIIPNISNAPTFWPLGSMIFTTSALVFDLS